MARTKEFDREQVLRKAVVVFWEKGYEATSIPDLLQAMGLSRSSLYETFGDKEALYYEAIQHYTKMSQLKRDLLTHAVSAKEGIRKYFEMHINWAFAVKDEQMPNGCLITNASLGLDHAVRDPLQSLIQSRFTELEQLFYEALEKGKASGEIDKDKDVALLAFLLLNLNHSINVMARVQSDISKVRRMMEAVIEQI